MTDIHLHILPMLIPPSFPRFNRGNPFLNAFPSVVVVILLEIKYFQYKSPKGHKKCKYLKVEGEMKLKRVVVVVFIDV